MDRTLKVVVAVLSVAVIGLGSYIFGYRNGSAGQEPLRIDVSQPGAGLAIIHDAYDEIRGKAVNQPTEDELARGAIRGMIKVLQSAQDDPYALFFSPNDYESFRELTTGRFSGIGVWLKPDAKQMKIVSVLPDTPAAEAGLKEGDIIRTVDGEAVVDLTVDEAAGLIKGPEGTKVSLEIERDGDSLSFDIERQKISLPAVKAALEGTDIGYIRLLTFSNGAAAQTRLEIERLLTQGAKGIVLDMRDNGGGVFDEAIDVASLFIEDGPVVRYKQRGEDEIVYEAKGDAYEKVPVVVLVNGGTASASEIVAGALQDSGRVVIVGTTTFGKGSVQQLVPLPDGSAMKLTIAAYFTPKSGSIDGKGIAPDVEVSKPTEQKGRAFQILRGLVLSANSWWLTVATTEEKPGTKLIAENRRARHDYFIEETVEAGLILTGTEVKSCRAGKVNLGDAYAHIRDGEAWLIGCHISPYSHGNRMNHDPVRNRKLLLHRKEIERLHAKVSQEGKTLVPTRIYFKHGLVKIELSVAKGKKSHDKRETIAKRDADRSIARNLGRRR